MMRKLGIPLWFYSEFYVLEMFAGKETIHDAFCKEGCGSAAFEMCIWALEQPAPRVKAIFELSLSLLLGEHRRVQTFMGAFSAPTAKPTYIYSSGKWHCALSRAPPLGMAKTGTIVEVVSKTGKKGSAPIEPDVELDRCAC